ncbi:cold-shock protein [Pueribacillus theae]|uniref:Cold-shock protein n=1 Tax=Pueribacillus theae TaxID=2171751 RepID=A0A2U1JVS4_9BACI|nr:cold-shock protein [Pueribacillus theae]PWA09059.1 cold-shock protein [Pueribacillus theae]
MVFSRRQQEPIPEIETEVWSCVNHDCTGWMRNSFSFLDNPTCPLCQSEMKQEVRILPELK